jgi:ABC-type Fe3+ transport system permease subunit
MSITMRKDLQNDHSFHLWCSCNHYQRDCVSIMNTLIVIVTVLAMALVIAIFIVFVYECIELTRDLDDIIRRGKKK